MYETKVRRSMKNMFPYKFAAFLCLLIIKDGICFENCKPNVAIIGGGIGGASASHFLTELFENNVHIDLYEANKLGGRLATVNIAENEYESGGSIIHYRNKYMQDFAKLLGLQHRTTDESRVGIWNGDEFVFVESEWQVVSLAKLIYKYGLQPFRLNRYINSILSDFEKIYDLQDGGKSFENVTALLASMNTEFPNLLGVPIKNHLIDLGYKENLIDELVRPTMVVNYGQDTNVQTFVGCVSLAGIGSELWSVKGGNKKVPEHLIYRNGNISVISSHVKKVRLVSTDTKPQYEVHYSNKDSAVVMKAVYDIVILATPLTKDQKLSIEFEGFPKDDFHSIGEYHTTIATFVKAELNPHYFNLVEDLDILSCNPNKTIVNSLGKLTAVEGPTKNDRVWKIFSNAPLKSAIIHEMFSNVEEQKEVIWKAYPQYSSGIRHDKFQLHDALYHVNAIEWAASAMEMSAIGGRNVAILAHKDFSGKCVPKVAEKLHRPSSDNKPSTEL